LKEHNVLKAYVADTYCAMVTWGMRNVNHKLKSIYLNLGCVVSYRFRLLV